MECNGFGYCLTSGIQVICDFNCKHEKCPNFFICSNRAPRFMLEFNRGVCNECSTHLGKCPENPTSSNPVLEQKQLQSECPVCLQTVGVIVKNPRCNHCLCVSCFKAIYWCDESLLQELPFAPTFPYSEHKEDEYYQDPNSFLNDELVTRWKKEIGSWNEERIQYILENKKYLKHCPICRS